MIAAVGMIFYASALSYPLAFDSLSNLNPNHLQKIANAFHSNSLAMLQQRSVAWLSFILSPDLSPYSFALGNIIIHCLNAILLFIFSQLIFTAGGEIKINSTKLMWLSFFAAIIFIVHPVAVYAVAYHIQRSILLAVFFSLLTFIFFICGYQKKNYLFLFLATVCYFFAIHSKEHIIILPLGFIALAFSLGQQTKIKPLLFCLGISAIFAVQIALSSKGIFGQTYEPWAGLMQNKTNPNAFEIMPQVISDPLIYPMSVLNQMFLFFRYFALWILPIPQKLAIDIALEFPENIFSFRLFFGAFLFLAYTFFAGFILSKNKTKKILGFILILPALLFSAEFSVVRYHEAFVLYRSYLCFFCLPLLIPALCSSIKGKIIFPILMLTCLVFSTVGLLKLKTFASPISLWQDAASQIDISNKKLSSGYRPFVFLGGYLAIAGKNPEAVKALETAISLNPNFYLAYYNLGLTYSNMTNFSAAIKAFESALKLSPQDGSALYNLANAYLKNNEFEKAIATYQKLITLDANTADYHHNLGIAYASAGKNNEAVLAYQSSLKLEPHHNKAHYNLANTLMSLNQTDKAITHYEIALQISPKYTLAMYNLAIAYLDTNEKIKAEKLLKEILTIDKNFKPAQDLLSKITNQEN